MDRAVRNVVDLGFPLDRAVEIARRHCGSLSLADNKGGGAVATLTLAAISS